MKNSESGYIFVLYNSNKENDKIISQDCLCRIKDAEKMIEAHPDFKAVFVGGNPKLMKENTIIRDVELLETPPHTVGNIRSIADFLRKKDICEKIFIITSRYHFRRVEMLLDHFGVKKEKYSLVCLNFCGDNFKKRTREFFLRLITRFAILFRNI
ncbi:MAG: hypothetical protein ACOYS2_00260 [Patescibacteria group bacterium]